MDSHELYTRQDSEEFDEHQLDLEVNRFLEADFARQQLNNRSATRADPLSDEMRFMDIRDSIDIPDLDFADRHHPPTTTEVSDPRPSLRVVIPASALLLPPPPPASKARPKRKAAKQTWSAIWSKRQKAVKNELLSLYQQVNNLEGKLDELQRNSSTSEADLKRILKHEIAAKHKSEAENAKLKRMLVIQLETSRKVAQALQKFEIEDHAEEHKEI